MFVTVNQLLYFTESFFVGVLAGVVYSVLYFFKRMINNKIYSFVSDTVFFVFSAFLYIFVSYNLKFASLRAYMIFGFFCGYFSEIKSFHIFVAKITEKVYNRYTEFIKRKFKPFILSVKEKIFGRKRYDGSKKEKSAVGGYGYSGTVVVYTGNHNGLSARRNVRKEKRNSKTQRRNAAAGRAERK